MDPFDNLVLPFEVKTLDARGRVVRLGTAVDEIVSKHGYPKPVSILLAEAVALVALLGSGLKMDGKLILQTSTDGPVSMIVVDYTVPGQIRGYARYDAQTVSDRTPRADLMGKGHLALTIDQGPDMERYQGIVALDGQSLGDAAHAYFRQSEQIPTSLKLAAGEFDSGDGGTWRAGAILVQHLPGGRPPAPVDLPGGDGDDRHEHSADENWDRARVFLESTEHHELLDPALSPQDLLYRLYHEDGVTVYPESPLSHACTCSRERMAAVLDGFSDAERRDMVKDGVITVTCQFCSNEHVFDYTS